MPRYVNELKDELLKHYKNIPLDKLQSELNEISKNISTEVYTFEFDFEDESMLVFSGGQAEGLKGAA